MTQQKTHNEMQQNSDISVRNTTLQTPKQLLKQRTTHKSKKLITGDEVYKLSYKLYLKNGQYHLYIKSEKREMPQYKAKTVQTESEDKRLPFKNYSEAFSFFNQIVENSVFPCSLQYILEDMGYEE